MKNNGDNLVFGGEDKCEEWPAEGADFQNKYSKEKGVILAVYDDYVWCKYPGIHPMTLGIDRIQKPKTPEEELRDHMLGYFSEAGYEVDKYVDLLISNYNITKKPQ